MDKEFYKDYTAPHNLAHPGFEDVGLGDIAYLRRNFENNGFVYLLTAANGEIIYQDESRGNIEEYAAETGLHLITVH
ncbi:MAG: hypothetical protein EA357_03570 [Micavibrio sp.]|jgi:hypothetical protein|nr:MAG: hypothetical protein EA357_03570 [Micavibrio sp.]